MYGFGFGRNCRGGFGGGRGLGFGRGSMGWQADYGFGFPQTISEKDALRRYKERLLFHKKEIELELESVEKKLSELEG